MSKLTSFLGIEKREVPPSDPSTAVIPPSRSTTVLNTTSALGIGAVYRSAVILATAGSQLTLDVTRDGEPVARPSLIRKPDASSSLSDFIEDCINSLSLHGNAYWRLYRNARNEVVTAVVLDPNLCEPQLDGTLLYKGATLKSDAFYHLKYFRLPGVLKGLGPIQAARAELQGSLDLRDYQSEWFNSGDVPTGVLSTDSPLTKEKAEEYSLAWAARDAHRIAVLGAGLKYTPTLINPEDAQFLQVAQFSITGIARLFGIPAHLLLAVIDGSSMTYSNISQADLVFVRWTLMKYLRAIEEAFSAILPGIQVARFNLDAILRPDTTTRYQAHQIAITGGFMTPNEVRAIEGLPPITGGDVLKTASVPTPTPGAVA